MKSTLDTTKQIEWSIGEDLVCPITHELFVDPVLCSDGILYERRAIEQYFQTKHGGRILSPITRKEMTTTTLVEARQIKNHIQGLVDQGFIRGTDALQWRQRKQELKEQVELIEKAKSGHMASMVDLAINYHNGEAGFEEDNEKAFQWFNKARESGNVTGMAEAGHMLVQGLGARKNTQQGFLYMGMAAGLGSTVAAYYLGFALAEGRYGIPVDEKDAIPLLEKALSDCRGGPGDNGVTEEGKREARRKLAQLKPKDEGV